MTRKEYEYATAPLTEDEIDRLAAPFLKLFNKAIRRLKDGTLEAHREKVRSSNVFQEDSSKNY